MRRTLLPLLVVSLLLVAATAASADEVIVLDNGQVLRGWAIRENDDTVLLRLTGFVREATVQIQKSRIVKRFGGVTEEAAPSQPTGEASADWAQHTDAAETQLPHETQVRSRWAPDLPEEEPSIREEGFFQRLARRSIQSVPATAAARTVVGILLFIALLVLVTLGARVAEIESLDLVKTTILAMLLGGILFANVWFHQEILRADRALWILPLQGALWLVAALSLLHCGMARAVLLFSFVLFSITVAVFMFGVILMSF